MSKKKVAPKKTKQKSVAQPSAPTKEITLEDVFAALQVMAAPQAPASVVSPFTQAPAPLAPPAVANALGLQDAVNNEYNIQNFASRAETAFQLASRLAQDFERHKAIMIRICERLGMGTANV